MSDLRGKKIKSLYKKIHILIKHQVLTFFGLLLDLILHPFMVSPKNRFFIIISSARAFCWSLLVTDFSSKSGRRGMQNPWWVFRWLFNHYPTQYFNIWLFHVYSCCKNIHCMVLLCVVHTNTCSHISGVWLFCPWWKWLHALVIQHHASIFTRKPLLRFRFLRFRQRTAELPFQTWHSNILFQSAAHWGGRGKMVTDVPAIHFGTWEKSNSAALLCPCVI